MVNVTLQAGAAAALILPEMGAGLARLDWRGLPVLRPWTGRAGDGPFALAMNLLAPFSNRISQPFAWAGARHGVPPNLPGEPFAIHGDAFQRAWTVEDRGTESATLSVTGGIGPWRHVTRVTYALAPGGLTCALSITNAGDAPLPFGGGFHPWFPRAADTAVAFRATGWWPEDARHLPATTAPQPLPPDLVRDLPGPLPAGWINAGLAGWDGRATIQSGGLRILLGATGCATLLLYSPGAAAGFFCLEPVSHPVDAHNLPGRPGLIPLAPGETLHLGLSLAWDAP